MGKIKNGLRKLIYKTIAFCVHRKSILFESAPDFSDNTRPVFDEMLRRGLDKKYNLVWKISDNKKLPIENPHVGYIVKNPTKLAERVCNNYYLESAKCLICCNRFLMPTTKSQFAVFLSHGTPIKYVRDYYNIPESIDYCVSASEAVAGTIAFQSRYPEERVVSLGYPRNDVFSREAQDVKAALNTKCKKVIVWYPTFRQHKGGIKTAASNALPVIHDSRQAERLNAYAAQNDVLIVLKPHFAQDLSYVKDLGLSNIRIIYDDFFERNQISSYEFLAGCDAMITDYSSVYFDYTLADKPIGAVWEDIDEYRQNPGFAIDIDYYMQGAEKIYGIEQFEAFVKNVAVGNDPLREQRRMIRDLVNCSTDGKNTQRVVDFIIQKANL